MSIPACFNSLKIAMLRGEIPQEDAVRGGSFGFDPIRFRLYSSFIIKFNIIGDEKSVQKSFGNENINSDDFAFRTSVKLSGLLYQIGNNSKSEAIFCTVYGGV
jgi:hypothetical protein